MTTSSELPDEFFDTGALLEEDATEEALTGAPQDEVQSEGGEG